MTKSCHARDSVYFKFGDLVKVCDGNRTTAHVLDQAIRWHNYKKGDFFYNSDREYAEKVDLETRTFQRHKKILKAKGFLIVEIRMFGGRPLSYCKIDVEKIYESIPKKRILNSSYAVGKVLEKRQARCVPKEFTNDTDPAESTTLMSHDQRHGCRRTNDMSVVNTLSYNTSYNTSSSLEVPPIPDSRVVEHQGEENNIYYGKSEQPEAAPVPPIEAHVNLEAPQPPPQANNANAIKPVDMKVITERMLEIWNRLCAVAKVDGSSSLSFLLLSRFNDSFQRSFDEWEAYCKKIASSKFLMGERPMEQGKHKGEFYKLSLVQMLQPQTILKVKSGMYDPDRAIPLSKSEYDALLQKKGLTLKQREETYNPTGNSRNEKALMPKEDALRILGDLRKQMRSAP